MDAPFALYIVIPVKIAPMVRNKRKIKLGNGMHVNASTMSDWQRAVVAYLVSSLWLSWNDKSLT